MLFSLNELTNVPFTHLSNPRTRDLSDTWNINCLVFMSCWHSTESRWWWYGWQIGLWNWCTTMRLWKNG